MDTIFIKCIYKRTSDPHRLLLNLTDKINLKRSDKYIPLSNLCIYYTWKNIKIHAKLIDLRYQLQHVMKSLIYIKDHFLCQIFKPILSDMRQ